MTFSTILIKTKIGGARVEESLLIADSLEEQARAHGFRVIRDVKDLVYPENTVMIPIGGDGTVLFCAKEVISHQIPVIGINVGNLGFLTDVVKEDAYHSLFNALREPNNLMLDRRTVISVNIGGIDYMALNDVVISDLYADSIIEYELRVGSANAGKHKANSVIISTPTGSTAYAMFAGGAIIEPDLDVLEIIPVAAMTMTARPMIVSGCKPIQVTITPKPGSESSIKADGIRCAIPQHIEPLTVTITRLEQKITLLHSPKWNFYDVLSNKLGWNS